jgi:hypothetical protein
MTRLPLIVVALAVVLMGWTYRNQLPFLHGRVASAAAAEGWLRSRATAGTLGGTPGAEVVERVSCTDSSVSAPLNPEVLAVGGPGSLYDCRPLVQGEQAQHLCVVAIAMDTTLSPEYTLAPGGCSLLAAKG